MTNDSRSFMPVKEYGLLPLKEAKMLHQYDHRWSTFDGKPWRDVRVDEKMDPGFETMPQHWIRADLANDRHGRNGTASGWLVGWRQNARGER
jgi:hypothetical protein